MSVPSQYPSHFPARIAFVGEAPGTDEVDKGIPLVGASGRVFNSMLRTANLDRAEFYIGNVFDFKLADNEVSSLTAPAEEAKAGGFDDIPPIGKSGYLRPEYRPQLDRLRAEIMDVRPTVIVPLGATALWAFTGQANITAHRGSVTRASYILPGAKLFPTYHPAFVLRQWKFFTIVVADFVKAFREGGFRDIRIPHKELLIDPTREEVQDYVPRLLASDLLSVDIETGWGQITCIGFAPNAEQAICIPLVDLRKPNKSYWQDPKDEAEVWKIMKKVMESGTPLLGQNFGGYDAFWILDKAGIKPKNFRHDTRLIHHALYPELPKDLEFMGASYTQQGAWKSWGHKAQEKRDS